MKKVCEIIAKIVEKEKIESDNGMLGDRTNASHWRLRTIGQVSLERDVAKPGKIALLQMS